MFTINKLLKYSRVDVIFGRCSLADGHVIKPHMWRFFKSSRHLNLRSLLKLHRTSRMKVLLTTLCLVVGSMTALPHLPNSVESSDPDMIELMKEVESMGELDLERREECTDTTRLPSLCKRYCHIGKIAEGVCRKTCGMCDLSCVDSFKYGCKASWCSHDIIADTKCERTCGTCDQTCLNSYKFGCKEEWCQNNLIAEKYCQKTCGTCVEEGEDGGCSRDTLTPCPDGSCKASIMECFGEDSPMIGL